MTFKTHCEGIKPVTRCLQTTLFLRVSGQMGPDVCFALSYPPRRPGNSVKIIAGVASDKTECLKVSVYVEYWQITFRLRPVDISSEPIHSVMIFLNCYWKCNNVIVFLIHGII